MVLPFRPKALMSWSEMVSVNRSTDDEDDGNAVTAANDMDKLSIRPDGETLAARVKLDFELPAPVPMTCLLGLASCCPNGTIDRATSVPNHCVVQVMQARPGERSPLSVTSGDSEAGQPSA